RGRPPRPATSPPCSTMACASWFRRTSRPGRGSSWTCTSRATSAGRTDGLSLPLAGGRRNEVPSHSGLITVMERAARKAAGRLRRDFGEVEHLQVSRKGPADFVSLADRRTEQSLVEELRRARPDWGLLLEEGGSIEGDPARPRWVVDPIDGTSNFLHSIPHFAVSIAVQEPRPGGQGWGELSHALVYQPLTDESFWAEKGRGAWLHDRRLRVSSRRDLAEALIATGTPFRGHGDAARWLRIAGAV